MDNKEEKYQRNTQNLKELFKKSENSGKIAWTIGSLLYETHINRLYRSNYKNFDKYTLNEFGKSGQTARIYIKIYNSFGLDEISDNMLVTHLKVISEFAEKEIAKPTLKALNDLIEYQKENNSKALPSEADLRLTLAVLSKNNEVKSGEILDTLKYFFHESQDRIRKRKKRKKSDQELIGRRLKASEFSGVEDLFENEPIDEMGTVALFCTIFHLIKGETFKLKENIVSFQGIKFVRSPFPDTSIRIEIHSSHKSVNRYLLAEFEFESKNYITHKHFNDPENERCELIICWIDNLMVGKPLPTELLKVLPGVVELKSVLETGKIVVRKN